MKLIMNECSICNGDDESLREAKNESGVLIQICISCSTCTCCNDLEEGEIDVDNWKIIRRLQKLHGWNLEHNCPNWNIVENYEFLCNGCIDLWCSNCKSIDDCKKRCNDCNEPCCNECDCVKTKEPLSGALNKER